MRQIEDEIEMIRQKALKLSQSIGYLKQEKKLLQDENSRSKENEESLRKKIEELELKNLNLQLGKNIGRKKTTEDNKVKYKLEELIKEIDECIAHLKG